MKPIVGLINHAAAVNDVLIVFRLGKSLSNSRFFHSSQLGEIYFREHSCFYAPGFSRNISGTKIKTFSQIGSMPKYQ